MKKLLVSALVLVFVVGLIGCGKRQIADIPPAENTTTTSVVVDEQQDVEPTQPTEEEEKAAETTVPAITTPGSDIDFRMITLETKFPFIFDSKDEWLQEYLDKYEYVNVGQLRNGALYVLDFKTNEIRMLIESGVTLIRETPNTLFCVVDGKTLIRIDYYGENIEVIYEEEQADIINFERYYEYGCLTKKDRIVCINLTTYEQIYSFEAPSVTNAVMYSSYQVCWWDDSATYYYLYDISNGVTYPLTETEWDMLCSGMIVQTLDLYEKYISIVTKGEYQFKDLDGNGKQELIIYRKNGKSEIVTISDGEPVVILSIRSMFFCEGNIIGRFSEGSGGMTLIYYQINGQEAVIKDVIMRTSSDGAWYHSSDPNIQLQSITSQNMTRITKETALNMREQYALLDDEIPWFLTWFYEN